VPSVPGVLAVGLLLTTSGYAIGQTRAAFEAASVKRNVSGSRRGSTQLRPGGRLAVVNENLRSLVRDAYGEGRLEVVGGPKWLDTDTWDIAATAGRDVADDDAWAMLRTLLEQRFKLVARREIREQPIYALVPAGKRSASPLRPSSTDCPITGNPCGIQSAQGRLVGTAAEMSDLVRSLSRVVGRPVIDKTGLSGRFDFTVTWTPDVAGTLESAAPDAQGNSIFTALTEQLNLKLEPQRGPVAIIVVDSAERPLDD